MSAAVALANLDIFEREGLNEHVRDNAPALPGDAGEAARPADRRRRPRRRATSTASSWSRTRPPRRPSTTTSRERLLRGFLSKALFDAGLYCRADDRGDPVVQLAPPLIIGQARVRRDRADPALGAHRGMVASCEPIGRRSRRSHRTRERTRVRRIPREGGRTTATPLDAVLDAGARRARRRRRRRRAAVRRPRRLRRRRRSGALPRLDGLPAVPRARRGAPTCVTVTLLDGLVLARTAFESSMNYRCVMVLGTVRRCSTARTSDDALRVITEHLLPGRWDGHAGRPSRKERGRHAGARAAARRVLASRSRDRRARGRPAGRRDPASRSWAGIVPLARGRSASRCRDEPRAHRVRPSPPTSGDLDPRMTRPTLPRACRCGGTRLPDELRRPRGRAARRATRPPTSPSSAPATPGCGRRTTSPKADPSLRVVVLEAETAGLRRQRPQRRLGVGAVPRRRWTRWPGVLARGRDRACSAPCTTPSTRSAASPPPRAGTSTAPRAARSASPAPRCSSSGPASEVAHGAPGASARTDSELLDADEARERLGATDVLGAHLHPALRRDPPGPARARPRPRRRAPLGVTIHEGTRVDGHRARASCARAHGDVRAPHVVRATEGTPRRCPGTGATLAPVYSLDARHRAAARARSGTRSGWPRARRSPTTGT